MFTQRVHSVKRVDLHVGGLCGLTLKATGAQHSRRSRPLLSRVRVCRLVRPQALTHGHGESFGHALVRRK